MLHQLVFGDILAIHLQSASCENNVICELHLSVCCHWDVLLMTLNWFDYGSVHLIWLPCTHHKWNQCTLNKTRTYLATRNLSDWTRSIFAFGFRPLFRFWLAPFHCWEPELVDILELLLFLRFECFLSSSLWSFTIGLMCFNLTTALRSSLSLSLLLLEPAKGLQIHEADEERNVKKVTIVVLKTKALNIPLWNNNGYQKHFKYFFFLDLAISPKLSL